MIELTLVMPQELSVGSGSLELSSIDQTFLPVGLSSAASISPVFADLATRLTDENRCPVCDKASCTATTVDVCCPELATLLGYPDRFHCKLCWNTRTRNGVAGFGCTQMFTFVACVT